MINREPRLCLSPAGIGRGRRQRVTPPGVPHPVDAHVGGRLRLRRNLLRMSQEKLADAVGLTFQQIQKYERGANRIGSSKLYQFSRILDVPVSFFFEDMSEEALSSLNLDGDDDLDLHAPDDFALDEDPLTRQETLELVQAYYRIQDKKVRQKVLELLRSLTNLPEEH